MGADASVQKEWHVDPTVAYETESYKLLKGNWSGGARISVFGAKNGQGNMESLIHSAKMLRTLRHPCIMKHIQSSKLSGGFYLVTDDVIPLEILLSNQDITLVEVIAGLHNVLTALDFLHSKCNIQHNRVNTSSIFVASDGSWKLGGFEDARKCDVRTPKEEPVHSNDMFAFGELANHLLNFSFSDNSYENERVGEFLVRIKEECLISDASKSITSKELSLDMLFNDDFVEIKSFLQNVVLKPEDQKTEFFQSLNKRLSVFSSSMIANHVLPLVWSRLVFLEPSAKKHFLPCLLRPQQQGKSGSAGLLPPDLYKAYVIPKLLKILNVHDHQVRLLILDHFNHFAHLFSKEELHEVVLPEILLGVRDSSSDMVAASLRALATLVKLLGACVVIGQKNRPIFTDNRPNKSQKVKEKTEQSCQADKPNSRTSQPSTYPVEPLTDLPVTEVNSRSLAENATSAQEYQPDRLSCIPERSSPDGGESAEDEVWSDWEDEKPSEHVPPPTPLNAREEHPANDGSAAADNPTEDASSVQKSNPTVANSHGQLPTGLGEEFDIMALDIIALKDDKADVDYFSDMEPKLLPQNSFETKDLAPHESKKLPTLFSVLSNGAEQECSGWDDSNLQVDW